MIWSNQAICLLIVQNYAPHCLATRE